MRHFSLYEFAFNPRVELILRTDFVMSNRFNANLTSIEEMEPVDKAETERLKAFLNIGKFDIDDSIVVDEGENRIGTGSGFNTREATALDSQMSYYTATKEQSE